VDCVEVVDWWWGGCLGALVAWVGGAGLWFVWWRVLGCVGSGGGGVMGVGGGGLVGGGFVSGGREGGGGVGGGWAGRYHVHGT